jgi:hypothetical protein
MWKRYRGNEDMILVMKRNIENIQHRLQVMSVLEEQIMCTDKRKKICSLGDG